MTLFDTPTARAYARMTGLFYLTIAVAGGYAILYVPSVLQVSGDPAATLANIAASRGLYLSGLAGDVVMMLAEVMVTAMLFFMFRAVNPTLSLAAALARFAMVAVMAAMLFFHAGALYLADATAPLSGFDSGQRAELAGLLFHMHDAGVWIWQIFFAVHLVILGGLVLKSDAFPRLIGYGLAVGGIGYVLDTLNAFAFPGVPMLETATMVFLLLVTMAELSFALWLVTVGPRWTADTGRQVAA